MTEWSRVHDWKSCVPVRVPRVRIPLSPQRFSGKRGLSAPRLQDLSKNITGGPLIQQRDCPLTSLRREVHVALRRAEVDVPGELLDGLRGRATHGEVAAEGMAQHV